MAADWPFTAHCAGGGGGFFRLVAPLGDGVGGKQRRHNQEKSNQSDGMTLNDVNERNDGNNGRPTSPSCDNGSKTTKAGEQQQKRRDARLNCGRFPNQIHPVFFFVIFFFIFFCPPSSFHF